MHCTINTKTNAWKLWHIILCTLLFSVVVGAILYFLFDTAAPTIHPMIILPLPALLIKLCMQDRIEYPSYILTMFGFAVSLIALDFLVYYFLEYGSNAIYFVMWEELAFFVYGMTMLELSLLFPVYISENFQNRILLVVLHIFTAILIILFTAVIFTVFDKYSISYLYIFIFSSTALTLSTIVTMFLHNKSLRATQETK